MSRRTSLFTVLGIGITVKPSVMVIFLLLSSSMTTFLSKECPGRQWWAYLAAGLLASFLLFSSVIMHELAHAIVGRRQGIEIEGITLFMLGGVASTKNMPPTPKAEFSMSIAGPGASLCLSAGFIAAAFLMPNGLLFRVAFHISILNSVLAIFNTLPILPMDGGRVLRSILWKTSNDLVMATKRAYLVGRVFSCFLLAFAIFMILSGGVLGGIWLIIITAFIHSASRSECEQVILVSILKGVCVRDVMVVDNEPDAGSLITEENTVRPGDDAFQAVVKAAEMKRDLIVVDDGMKPVGKLSLCIVEGIVKSELARAFGRKGLAP